MRLEQTYTQAADLKLSGLIQPLIDAKAPHEQIMAVVLAFEAQQVDALEQRRKTDAERQARKREREASSRDVTLRHSDRSLMREPVHVEDKSLTSEIEPQVKKEQKETRDALFDQFWSAFPNKVGKPKARAAFPTAMRRAKSFDAIMDGLDRYIANKPPDRAFLNPATFLNQERWADQPAPTPSARDGPPAQARVPQLADMFKIIKENANGRQEREDRSGAGAAVSYLPSVRSG